MLSLLAALALGAPQDIAAKVMALKEPNGKPPRLMIQTREIRLDPPKLSPKLFGDPPIRWEFDWIAFAQGADETRPRDPKTGEPWLRTVFRVYSQEKRANDDKTEKVARQAIRMWDLVTTRYRIDHNPTVNNGIVDYYLCWGGKAGGEQLLGQEILPDKTVKTVNTIYIYDLRSFNGPVEMAREVAHEYGHAVLPAVGGYTAPEYWGNGFLGEKLFLRWLRDKIAANQYGPDDAMGSPLPDLDNWVKKNVDPLVIKAASEAPSQTTLEDKGPVGLDAYMGLVLYADTIFPSKIVGRSLMLTGSQDAKDYPQGLLMATQEVPKITLSIPAYLKGKPLWIPLGNGKVAQASIVARKGDWAQIKPQTGAVVITTAR